MIEGIGVDIVQINRFRLASERWGRKFLEKVFTEREIDHCYKKSEPYSSFAIRFAAKEAVLKALGTGGFWFKDIEVLNREDGSPFVNCRGELERVLSSKGIGKLHLSLSHEREYGIAFVLAEKA